MQKTKPLASGIAFLFLALLLAGLVARFWLSDQEYRYTGPTHIASGQQHIFLFAAGDIYRLTHAGELLDVTAPGTTGLHDDPIDLRVMPGGALLIAEQRPATIRVCDADNWVCRPLVVAADTVIERQFKLLPGMEANQWLLTDARGDTLWGMDGAGGAPRKLLSNGVLAGPNGLVFGPGGTLWVADTDHRRIVELLPAADGSYLPGREHSAVNGLTIGERFYPMMLAHIPDAQLWVIQAAEFSEPLADIVVYDAGKGPLARVSLPPGAYPTDIAALPDSVLVTDLERFTVYRVQNGSLEVSEFGDERFRSRMAQLSERRDHYNRLSAWSMAAIVLFAASMILAAVVATPGERRWTQPPPLFDFSKAPEQTPGTNGIHWLERDPRTDRALKFLQPLVTALFLLMIAGALALYLWVLFQAGPDPAAEQVSQLNRLGLILLLGGLLGALVLPVIHYSLRAMKRRIGTDGKRLYIRLPDGRELAVDPSQLAHTNRAVLYRQYTLPLAGGKQQALYLPGEVETWLAPLLRQSRRLTATQALQHQWRNRDSLAGWLLIAAAMMGVTLIVISLLTA